MITQRVYRTGLRLSVALFALSLALPLHTTGEYEPGFSAVTLIIRTGPLVASAFDSLVWIVAYALSFSLYLAILLSLRFRILSRTGRLALFILFLLLLASAIVGNSRAHAFPSGPSAWALMLGFGAACAAYAWSLYDRKWE
jgi:hypothetical protein